MAVEFTSRNVDPALIERAYQLHQERYPVSVAAKEIGFTAATLREWAKRGEWGAWALPHERIWALRPQAKRLLAQGLNRKQISERLGVSYSVVKRWLADAPGSMTWRKRDCSSCKQLAECQQRERSGLPCCCEQDIEVEGLPERYLYSRNGGHKGIEQDYGQFAALTA